MIIQVFGKKSCNNTKKAERFFKERNVKIQFIDLNKYPISKGELKVITNVFPIEELLDIEGNEYKKRNLQYFVYDTEELLNTFDCVEDAGNYCIINEYTTAKLSSIMYRIYYTLHIIKYHRKTHLQ